MKTSEKIDQIAIALNNLQKELKGAVKDSKNTFFKSSYADLESVWESIRDPLTRNGFSVSQLMGVSADGPTLITILMHVSGQYIAGEQLITATKLTPQDMGSAITYSRRYGLAAIVGQIQVEDDGESSMSRDNSRPGTDQNKKSLDEKLAAGESTPDSEVPQYVSFIKYIQEMKTMEQLKDWFFKNERAISLMPYDQMNFVLAAKDKAKARLS